MVETQIDIVKVKPVRMIPFDIGCKINNKLFKLVDTELNKKYQTIEISNRKKTILYNGVVSYKINNLIELYIYSTGIGVIVLYDDACSFVENMRYFSEEYCKMRQSDHMSLLKWTHKHSLIIKDAISEVREIVKAYNNKGLRITCLDNWENQGISYVMTLTCIDINEENGSFAWSEYPDWLKNNIKVLLDPSIINMEDSLNFGKFNESESCEATFILNNLNSVDEPNDYEKRNHISTFMSWAAVVVLGNLSEFDLEEYAALEIELQHNWFYIYCLEKNLPETPEKLILSKMDAILLRNLSYEVELYEDRIRQIDDSSIPDRIKEVQEGLLRTSGILDLVSRYKRKLVLYKEILMFESQASQKKYSQTSEILLYFIAYIQIAPILSQFFIKYYNNEDAISMSLVVFFIAGCIVLYKKNR